MSSFKDLLPESLRAQVRQHPAWRRYSSRREAVKLATSSKRLDLCAAQMAHLLHTSGVRGLRGRTCLELGSGQVIGYALICHLLGAERIMATDITPLAAPFALGYALHDSTAYIVRDVLSPFEDHHQIRHRLDRLLAITEWTFESLLEIGIEYRAPCDLALSPLGMPIDFAYSFSVLEHVGLADVENLLRNVAEDLTPGGAMAHAIHLEDHKDSARDPFAFLGESTFSSAEEAERGNRLRKSKWLEILSRIEDVESRLFYEWSRPDAPLPACISMDLAYVDEPDLRVSHVGVISRKRLSVHVS